MNSNVAELALETKDDPSKTQLMVMSFPEAAASLRVLVFLANADGALGSEEIAVLNDAFAEATLPPGMNLGMLLHESIDLDAQLREITSPGSRERTYNGAYCIAHTTGNISPEQQKLLDRIRTGLEIPEENATLMGRMYAEAKDIVWKTNIHPAPTAAERKELIEKEIMKYSVFNSVIGAFPVPLFSIATDLLVVSLQVKMVRDIGDYWGHKVDKQAAWSIMGSIFGATGLRIAAHSLLNFVPFLGIPLGAGYGFSTTWALGRVANNYFEEGGKLDSIALRNMYKQAEVEAKVIYEKSKDTVMEAVHSHKKTVAKLNEDLAVGRISGDEYTRKLRELQ